MMYNQRGDRVGGLVYNRASVGTQRIAAMNKNCLPSTVYWLLATAYCWPSC